VFHPPELPFGCDGCRTSGWIIHPCRRDHGFIIQKGSRSFDELLVHSILSVHLIHLAVKIPRERPATGPSARKNPASLPGKSIASCTLDPSTNTLIVPSGSLTLVHDVRKRPHRINVFFRFRIIPRSVGLRGKKNLVVAWPRVFQRAHTASRPTITASSAAEDDMSRTGSSYALHSCFSRLNIRTLDSPWKRLNAIFRTLRAFWGQPAFSTSSRLLSAREPSPLSPRKRAKFSASSSRYYIIPALGLQDHAKPRRSHFALTRNSATVSRASSVTAERKSQIQIAAGMSLHQTSGG